MKYIIVVLFVYMVVNCFGAQAQNKPEDITGIWLTGGKEPVKIQIYSIGGIFSGKIIWMKNPTENGKPQSDHNNPEPEKRSYPVIGLVILNGFKFNGDDEWKGGEIYDPENGKTYSAFMYLKDRNTLRMRGFIGISLLGRTDTWTRTD